MKFRLRDVVWCILFVVLVGFTFDKVRSTEGVIKVWDSVFNSDRDDSVASKQGQELLELMALHDAYVGYRAYDDGEFSKEELDVLINPFNRDLGEELSSGKISRRAELEYERRVNELIDRVDDSEGHVKFKRYVLDAEREDVVNIGLDGIVDDIERELLSLAGDVTGFDVGIVESGIVESLGENGNRDMVSSYEEMLIELYGDDEAFDVSDVKYSWDREDLTFRVD